MNRWMWQATASVVRELLKLGHVKLGVALFALVVVCSTASLAIAVVAGGKAASSGWNLAKSQFQH
jgi:hypothetical protein